MLWSFQSKACASADTSVLILSRNAANLPQVGPTYQSGLAQVTFSAIAQLPDGTFSATIASSGTVGRVLPQFSFWYGPVPTAGGAAVSALDQLAGPTPSLQPFP